MFWTAENKKILISFHYLSPLYADPYPKKIPIASHQQFLDWNILFIWAQRSCDLQPLGTPLANLLFMLNIDWHRPTKVKFTLQEFWRKNMQTK